MTEWQDISTAPRSGMILLYTPVKFDTVGHGEGDTVIMATSPPGTYSGYWDEIDGAWCAGGATWLGPFIEPTHWMPLPSPPQDSTS